MGLLDTIKSALGLGSSDEQASRSETSVSVEHDPDTEAEDAVKGTGDEEPAAAGGDAAGSTGSITEEPPEVPDEDEADEVAEAAEPAEATGPQSQVEGPDETAADEDEDEGDTGEQDESETAAVEGDAAGSTGSVTEEPPEEGAAEPAEATGPGDGNGADGVENVSGIGPAYAERLADAGVETVADLREADATDLAEETGISEKRIERWQDRAGD